MQHSVLKLFESTIIITGRNSVLNLFGINYCVYFPVLDGGYFADNFERNSLLSFLRAQSLIC